MLLDTLLHELVKLGPEGALTGALAALDIALWDLKGKLLGQPIYKLLGGAWRTAMPFYASIGGNGERSAGRGAARGRAAAEGRSRRRSRSASTTIARTLDADIPGDIAKARAVRRLVGDDIPAGVRCQQRLHQSAARSGWAARWRTSASGGSRSRCSITTSGAMGEVARALDITVSAGEQTYTLAALADLIAAGVRWCSRTSSRWAASPGCMRCAALAHAHGVELVSHQTQPTIGHTANLHIVAAQLHASKPAEWNDPSTRTHAVFENPPKPVDGLFHLPEGPGLGLVVNEAELAKRRVEV